MKSTFLFNHSYKKYGWILVGLSIPLLIMYFFTAYANVRSNAFALIDLPVMGGVRWFTSVKTEILDEIVLVILLSGLMLIAFSKEKKEDEFIEKLRLESFQMAIFINYLCVIFAVIFTYNFAFFWFLLYNLLTPMLLYLLGFHWKLYKSNKIQDA